MTIQPVPSDSTREPSNSPIEQSRTLTNISTPTGAPLPPTTPQSPTTVSALASPSTLSPSMSQEDDFMMDDVPYSPSPMICSKAGEASHAIEIVDPSNRPESFLNIDSCSLHNKDTIYKQPTPLPNLNIGESVYELSRAMPHLNIGQSVYTEAL